MATPYMSLTLPTVGATLGPIWATELNAALTLIDSHNHTTGYGDSIPLSGLTLSDWDFDNNTITDLEGIQITNRSAVSTVNGTVYIYGNELHFKSSAGDVAITAAGAVNIGTTGSIVIAGGAGNQSFTYNEAGGAHSGALTIKEASTEYADINCGDIIIREHAAGITENIHIKSPTGLVAGYNFILPSALPVSTSILTIASTGQLNTTTTTNSATLKTNELGIIAWAATNYQISSSSGTFSTASGSYEQVTNLTVTITTHGRPIMVGIIADGSGNSFWSANGDAGLQISRDGSTIARYVLSDTNIGATDYISIPTCSIMTLDAVAAGVYTYTIEIKTNTGSATAFVYAKLFAYEL